jgi:hypothetical protein
MYCGECNIYYSPELKNCPQCNVLAIERFKTMTDKYMIDKHIRQFTGKFFRYYLEKNNINQKINIMYITKQKFINTIYDYINSEIEYILIYLSGLADGIRKCITSNIADMIFYKLQEYKQYSYEEMFKIIHAIGPFIIDPWNCYYDNIFLKEYYVRSYELLTLENIFNRWNYKNILGYFNDVTYANCIYCNNLIGLKSENTKCIKCHHQFHNECFNNPYHECKKEHHEINIDSLINELENF